MKRVYFILMLLAGCISQPAAQENNLLSKFEARTFSLEHNGTLPYRIYIPENTTNCSLLLFLHGAGERGQDNIQQLRNGLSGYFTTKMDQRYPCIIIAPQCPEDKRWVETDWSLPSHAMPTIPSIPLSLAIILTEEVRQQYNISPDKVILSGISMGGFGAWDIIQRSPSCFSKALIVCGGGDPEAISTDLRTTVRFYHGSADPLVSVQRSRHMHERLQNLGIYHEYLELPGAGHAIWKTVFDSANSWQFLFQN